MNQAEKDRQAAIEAYKAGHLVGGGNPIVIYPKGKRTVRAVSTRQGVKIRLYVGGRIWSKSATLEAAKAWVA